MSDEALVGALLAGKYRLKRCIGRGGMGAVYEAENVDFGKRVAIKIIEREVAASSEMATRFRREARAASAVESDHIVHVFDVGEDDALGLYLVMELLSGEDLAARLTREKKLPPEVVTAVGVQTARTLAQAHEAGVVHRDLKPANLFLTTRTDGAIHVKILDFGISKLHRAEPAEGAPEGDPSSAKASTLTKVGTLLGTPQYMSPEQAQGLPVDARSDVWSLGAVLYEALAGQPAFADTRTHEQMIIQIVTKKPAPLADIAPWVPRPVADAVHAALTHDLDARIQSAWVASPRRSPLATRRSGRRRRRRQAPSPRRSVVEAPGATSLVAAPAKPTIGATVVDAPARSPATKPVAIALLVAVASLGIAALVRARAAAASRGRSPVAASGAAVVATSALPSLARAERERRRARRHARAGPRRARGVQLGAPLRAPSREALPRLAAAEAHGEHGRRPREGVRMKPWRRLCALALAGLLAPSTAAAQGVKGAPDASEAKRHYDVADKLYAQSQYEPALSEYLTSYKLDPRKRSPLRNAADCQRKLNRFAEAYESYARLLEEHGDKLKPAEKKGVVQEMSELAQLTGTIEIASSEPGAAVTIDGVAVGATPLARPRRVPIARHKVRVTKAGFDPFEAEVEIASLSALKVDAALKPESVVGRLSVREQGGKPVHVVLDDKDMGPAPWEGELTAGEHALELTGDKLAAEKRTVTIPRKERLEVVLAAETLVGHLRVTVTPATAQIRVDGRPVGDGAWEGDVDPGVHQIDVALGEANAHREVTLRRGETMAQEIPIVVAPVVAPPSYSGLYGGFTLGWAFWLTQPHFDARFNPTRDAGASVSPGTPQAIPLTMRIGWAFQYAAVEFVATATVAHAKETFTLSHAMHGGTFTNDAVGISGFFGLGARYATKTTPARFTAGFAPGVVVRGMNYADNYQNNGCSMSSMGCPSTPNFSPFTTWVAPGIHADLGVMLGHTPGAKFVLGAELWMDFPRTVAIGPDNQSPYGSDVFPLANRSFVIAKSPEVLIGPTLGGVQWGH